MSDTDQKRCAFTVAKNFQMSNDRLVGVASYTQMSNDRLVGVAPYTLSWEEKKPLDPMVIATRETSEDVEPNIRSSASVPETSGGT